MQPNNKEFQRAGRRDLIKRNVLKSVVEKIRQQIPFVIPQANGSFIAKIEDGEVHKLHHIDIPFNSKSVISDNGLVVSLCRERNLLRIHEISGKLITEKKGSDYKAIACRGNTVFLGGEYEDESSKEGEVFVLLNLEDPNFEIKEIRLPIKLSEGKGIDDLLILEEELLVVDNMIFPKYLFRYDISSPNDPKHLETINLPKNGPYEYIIKGDLNEHWLVLFSSTIGRQGAKQHLSISGKEEGHISIGRNLKEKYHIKDFCLLKSELYILRSDCLGKIKLEEGINMDNFKEIITKKNTWERIVKTPTNQIILIEPNAHELVEKS